MSCWELVEGTNYTLYLANDLNQPVAENEVCSIDWEDGVLQSEINYEAKAGDELILKSEYVVGWNDGHPFEMTFIADGINCDNPLPLDHGANEIEDLGNEINWYSFEPTESGEYVFVGHIYVGGFREWNDEEANYLLLYDGCENQLDSIVQQGELSHNLIAIEPIRLDSMDLTTIVIIG